jgi:hypothetical protein
MCHIRSIANSGAALGACILQRIFALLQPLSSNVERKSQARTRICGLTSPAAARWWCALRSAALHSARARACSASPPYRWDTGHGFWVSFFGFQASFFGSRVSFFGSEFESWASGFGSRVSGLGFQDSGFGRDDPACNLLGSTCACCSNRGIVFTPNCLHLR